MKHFSYFEKYLIKIAKIVENQIIMCYNMKVYINMKSKHRK